MYNSELDTFLAVAEAGSFTRPTPNAGNCSGHLKSPPLTALFTTCGKPRFSQKPSPSKSMQKATETVLCFDRLSFAIKT